MKKKSYSAPIIIAQLDNFEVKLSKDKHHTVKIYKSLKMLTEGYSPMELFASFHE
jgi:hypothetical protein